MEKITPLAKSVALQIAKLDSDSVSVRLHDGDPTLWSMDRTGQQGILQRLGWIKLPTSSRGQLNEIERFSTEIHDAGYTHALLLA